MAKRTDRRTNKSEEIRKLVKGGAKPMEIQAKLAERGIKVSTPMIYTVRSKMKARRLAHKISRRRAAAANALWSSCAAAAVVDWQSSSIVTIR